MDEDGFSPERIRSTGVFIGPAVLRKQAAGFHFRHVAESRKQAVGHARAPGHWGKSMKLAVDAVVHVTARDAFGDIVNQIGAGP